MRNTALAHHVDCLPPQRPFFGLCWNQLRPLFYIASWVPALCPKALPTPSHHRNKQLLGGKLLFNFLLRFAYCCQALPCPPNLVRFLSTLTLVLRFNLSCSRDLSNQFWQSYSYVADLKGWFCTDISEIWFFITVKEDSQTLTTVLQDDWSKWNDVLSNEFVMLV